MKRYGKGLAGLFLCVALLGACGQKEVVTEKETEKSASSSQEVSSSKEEQKPDKVEVQSSVAQPLWDQEKSAQLANFIEEWSRQMGQVGYTVDQDGIKMVDRIYSYGDNVESQKLDTQFSPTGEGAATYRIVEVYKNWNKFPDVHTYYFAITGDGKGLVFHSPTTNGGKVYVKPTENREIQAGFESILNGEKVSPAPSSVTSVDQKNLTIDQCSNWARAHRARYYGNPYSKDDFIASITTHTESPDGFVYIEVRENHNSPTMRAAGADASVSSALAIYRINQNGQLELQDISKGSFQVVADQYFE
ncbi:DUF4767 domain-containing protein [Streptococcus pneumoniae]